MFVILDKTTKVVDAASQIKQQGGTRAYSRQFDAMKGQIDEVKGILESSSVSTADLESLENMITEKK